MIALLKETQRKYISLYWSNFLEKYLYNKILESLAQTIKKTNLLSRYILVLEKFFASKKFFEVLILKQKTKTKSLYKFNKLILKSLEIFIRLLLSKL